jgi:peptidoglycan/xylan/chitin deacetylase (PgdA/CDA1 family)
VKDVLVICYHAVSERWPADLAVAPQQLHDQLQHLVSQGYRGATFTAAVRDRPYRRTLAVTFDDAYASVLELALPILERLGLPATIYVPTAFAESERPLSWPGIDHWASGPHAAELRPLSWEGLGRLVDRGWEVGSHTRTHPRLTRLDDVALAEELVGSREDCERRLGRPCTSVAYPYGDVDDRVIDGARRAGYLTGAALSDSGRGSAPLHWPRLVVVREDSLNRFRRQASPVVRRLLASPAGPVAEHAYGTVRRRARRSAS